MQIGWLRHRVTIVEVTIGQSDTGAPEEVWTELVTVWADVRTASGSEQLEVPLEQMGSSTQFRVTMRYRDDLRPTMVLLWDDRVLHVHAIVEPDNRQRLIQLECSEEF